MPINLSGLARLAASVPDLTDTPVAPFRVAGRDLDTDASTALMGIVNLSPDSSYRESVALDLETAVRKALVQQAQGAAFVDVGAESTDVAAARVDAGEQASRLRPVVREMTDRGVPVSVECYDPVVARDALESGAVVLNLTGSSHDDEIFAMAAHHGASVIVCSAPFGNVREDDVVAVHDVDPFERALDHLGPRIEAARAAGVPSLAIDPGIGFYYGDLLDPVARSKYQTGVFLGTAKLRTLGLPICHALPQAFFIFGDELRTAESFFAVLALLGGTGILRTHEVPRVRAVAEALATLDVDPWSE